MWFESNPRKREYEDVFTGERKEHGVKSCPSSCPKILSKDLVQVGDLVVGAKEGGLVCEVPVMGCKECNKGPKEFCFKHTEEVDVGRSKLIRSKKRPLVMANEQGTAVLVVSRDKILSKEFPIGTPRGEMIDRRRNLVGGDTAGEKLYKSFHGIEPDKYLVVDIEEPSYLTFFGWLNHIIYDVPKRSERAGVPFIHEGKDRGDDIPPARKKPYVCVSPKFDYLVMFGSQFSFTERGIIG
jgi:hypothetical protein